MFRIWRYGPVFIKGGSRTKRDILTKWCPRFGPMFKFKNSHDSQTKVGAIIVKSFSGREGQGRQGGPSRSI